MGANIKKLITLHGAPWVLTRPHHLVADSDKLSAADNRKWDVRVHGGVDFGHSLIVGGKLVNVHSVILQFRHDFCLQK
jgi:hypothetical protein